MSLLEDIEQMKQAWIAVGQSDTQADEIIGAMTADAADTHRGVSTLELVKDASTFINIYGDLLPIEMVDALNNPDLPEQTRRIIASQALGHLSMLLTGELPDQPLTPNYPNEFA